MKKLVVGILAHVDAGKTTLSESMLFLSGKIKKIGRVDNKDAFLDNYDLERVRGITIFSKQALLNFKDTEITLLDTPGHVDFSAEMERTLQVLDYAILVINGADGVQSHTRTLWELLSIYNVPTFIFVNKMDQKGTNKDEILNDLSKALSDSCITFGSDKDVFFEQLAMCDEDVMNIYLETGEVTHEQVVDLIKMRKTFPVFFGSALKQDGVDTFINDLVKYTEEDKYSTKFAAKVYKISRDQQGNRLTHMKITGGRLKVKDTLAFGESIEKVNQIRIYSGEKFEAVGEVEAGRVCAVTGLTLSKPGEGLGAESQSGEPILEPVLSYQVILPDGVDERQMLPKFREIEEEEPELRVIWNEVLSTINIQVMGPVQLEILQSIIEERFNVFVTFGHGHIVYKETIANTVEGVGHFEPLRHYSEVHLILEPLERGRGLVFETDCSEDILDKNWQRLVLTHLGERHHRGVLTGAYITDMKITLVTGRAHKKHTAGGDFREATFRALRQGLMEAESVLLEPYYKFRLELPEAMVGRAMTDIDKMNGTSVLEKTDGVMALLTGSGPVSTMRNYQQEVNAYTKGEGRLSIALNGYDICHNADEVILDSGYDPERDVLNPTSSVFCSHGSGYLVPWDEVKSHMHLESVLKPKKISKDIDVQRISRDESEFISLEEIDSIINSTSYANQGRKGIWKKKRSARDDYYESMETYSSPKTKSALDEYLLVDGYNIIYSWPELNDLAEENMDAARSKLIDILSNYQPIRNTQIMLVFDAYRVEGRKESVETHHNIKIVFTGEAQTADHFIEKFAHDHKKKYRIVVATSDGLQQIIIRGAGAGLISARELRENVLNAEDQMSDDLKTQNSSNNLKMEDVLSDDVKDKLNKM